MPEFIDENLLLTAVLLAFIGAYGYVADSFRARRAQGHLLRQKVEAELTALKARVNPHFLFNALNTIYNEAQRADNETVADLIQQLAGIMRFTLQESTQPLTSVEHEFSFLEKYLALQRARLPQREGLQVATQLEWDGQRADIAPLLLIPFIENAYQYGISFVQPAFIELEVVVENRRLRMRVANSIAPAAADRPGPGTGIATPGSGWPSCMPGGTSCTFSKPPIRSSSFSPSTYRCSCYTPSPSMMSLPRWRYCSATRPRCRLCSSPIPF
ncbi:sensor histidine kinase [Hymenobacter lapidiphilus]|uniref:sensor histidine kinase n=1 Tax=Hymenobacter sp. CCM 8763 TaxID=2303334 RepID=UPI001F5BF40D|nr:sensor histidine kinase [Hymenobacter sp. CCM 8763]